VDEVARVARVVQVPLPAKLVERGADRLRIGAAAIEQPLELRARPIALAERPVAVAERGVERLAQAARSSGGPATATATALSAAGVASRSIGVTRSRLRPSAS
jgi:hypothetical protein